MSRLFLTLLYAICVVNISIGETAPPFTITRPEPSEFARLGFREHDFWYESNFWSGPGWTRIGRHWLHPGDENDAVRAFVVPKDGSISVTGVVKKLHLDGDGVTASIRHSDRDVWRREIEGKDDKGVDPNLSLDVKRGDVIRFIVNRRKAIACDTTGWAPVIEYSDGEKFDAAADFTGRQGHRGWFYEMNGPAEKTVRPEFSVQISEADFKRFSDGLRNPPEFEMMPPLVAEWIQDDDFLSDIKAAIRDHLDRTEELIAAGKVDLTPEKTLLAELRKPLDETALKSLYLRVRLLKRSVLLADPRMRFGELLFVKCRPTAYSHLVGQYFGWNQRPGGGLFVLERPGYSMKIRNMLGDKLSPGHVLEPRLSYDARRVAFSHVAVPETRIDWRMVDVNEQGHGEHYYHLYEMDIDDGNLRQLTSDCYDDMMPEYLPDGGLAFVSTRRRAYSRCFGAQFGKRWHSYTLFRLDGGDITQLSFNDVSEWFPAMSSNGTLLFGRWDYIDRDAVTHQNLWAMRPDGTNPVAVWGNATPNPHCTFQAKPIPDSNKIVFIASAHHSITAGPVCVLDPTVDANSLAAVRRITPGPFPESESRDIPEYYNSPWPLGEDLFLVAYSRDRLVFEPAPNPDAALGLYLIDNRGNRELIYRDDKIGSTCPLPIAPRPVPPPVFSAKDPELAAKGLGEMSIVDVYQGLGSVARGSLKQLRIVQIFPKSTCVVNAPRIGVAGEENTRAVLGVVPIEADGSARFTLPAGKPVLFQVLDEDGFAYQTMRSTTSVMPGEQVSCVGCHEDRMSAATRPDSQPIAFGRPASRLAPTPESGRPFGFVETVQPILDARCVSCHNAEKAEGGYNLSRRMLDNGFTTSYTALCRDEKMVPRFRERNQIQQTSPGGAIGARGSGLIRLLQQDHEGVELSAEELRRIGTWIDMNAVFYGDYIPETVELQRLGRPIPMPKLE